MLSLEFGDLPIARDRYTGGIQLQIANDYSSFENIYDSNKIFGGTKWTKKSVLFLGSFPTSLPQYWNDGMLTGFWNCDDGGKYYVSQFGKSVF